MKANFMAFCRPQNACFVLVSTVRDFIIRALSCSIHGFYDHLIEKVKKLNSSSHCFYLLMHVCCCYVIQGLSKNSSCLKEYLDVNQYIEYNLPLRSCNTMQSNNVEDSEEEYFNTIVLEPHPKLVTGMGKGFHVRCKYRKSEPANAPQVSMTILKNGIPVNNGGHNLPFESEEKKDGTGVSSIESIKIGDPLQITISVHSNTR